jgi:hypothetical protein
VRIGRSGRVGVGCSGAFTLDLLCVFPPHFLSLFRLSAMGYGRQCDDYSVIRGVLTQCAARSLPPRTSKRLTSPSPLPNSGSLRLPLRLPRPLLRSLRRRLWDLRDQVYPRRVHHQWLLELQDVEHQVFGFGASLFPCNSFSYLSAVIETVV